MENEISQEPLTQFDFTPTLIARKVTASGWVLSTYDQTNSAMPCGYVWKDGTNTPLNQWPVPLPSGTEGNTTVADINDSGIVVGNTLVEVVNNVTNISNPNFGGYNRFMQQTYWNPSSSAPTQMGGEPPGFVSPSPIIQFVPQPTVNFIADDGSAYGTYYSSTGFSEVAWVPGFSSAKEIAAIPTTIDNAYVQAISPDGQHLIETEQIYYQLNIYTLDGSPLSQASNTPNSTFAGVNDSGRYAFGNEWADGTGPLQGIIQLEAIGTQALGTTLGINGGNDILAQKGDGTFAMYTWTPPNTQLGTPGTYAENLLNITTPSGWNVSSLVSINDSRVLVGQITQGTATPTSPALFVPTALLVDANRDGVIDGNDVGATTASTPFRYWINDGDDTSQGVPVGQETVDSSTVDYLQHKIATEFNLQNFTRLWIDFPALQSALIAGQIQLGLKWENVTGQPAINLYASADPTGSLSFLSTDTAALAQITGSFNNAISSNIGNQTVDTSGTFILPSSVWSGLTLANPIGHFLFEGAGVGTGKLTLVILDGTGNELGEGPGVWLDLRSIKQMYLRGVAAPEPAYPYLSTSSQPPPPNIIASVDSTEGAFAPDPNEDTTHPTEVVFVHGYNENYDTSMSYAEIMFKRLWQNGYRGRFALFRWPTYGNGGDLLGGALGTYNDSEYVAWHSGTALMQFVRQNIPSNYQVDIAAHSLGNAVVGEALKEGLVVNHYAMLHAATSASCYDNGTSYPVTNIYTAPDTDSDPFTQSLGYTGYLGGIGSAIASSITNFYDENDLVITTAWNANNLLFKPQSLGPLGLTGAYEYDPTASSQQKLFLNTGILNVTIRYVIDPAEAKGYVDHSLTGTVGSQSSLAGAITANISADTFGNDHSYEWDHQIQDPETTIFYNSLLPNAFGITAIQLP